MKWDATDVEVVQGSTDYDKLYLGNDGLYTNIDFSTPGQATFAAANFTTPGVGDGRLAFLRFHVIGTGKGIDKVPLSSCFGTGVVVDMRYLKKWDIIGPEDFEKAKPKIEKGDWIQGKVWRRAPDGHVVIDLVGFQKWIESTT